MSNATKIDHNRISARLKTGRTYAQWVRLQGDQWVPLALAKSLRAGLGMPALQAGPFRKGSGLATYRAPGARYVVTTYARAQLQERAPTVRKPRAPSPYALPDCPQAAAQ